jgi:hypothetical protein
LLRQVGSCPEAPSSHGHKLRALRATGSDGAGAPGAIVRELQFDPAILLVRLRCLFEPQRLMFTEAGGRQMLGRHEFLLEQLDDGQRAGSR